MSDVGSLSSPLDRRRFLATGLGVAGGAALWAGGLSGTAVAADESAGKVWRGKTTANGWPLVEKVPEHRIEGAGAVTVPLLAGDVAVVLLHVARRYHYEIASLGEKEVTGHVHNRKVAAPYESNYLSGTAMALRPALYPAGVKGGFFTHELIIVRDILAELEGVVRWGGDEATAKESHFQIDVGPGSTRLEQVAAKIRKWNDRPGKGAGATDPLLPKRLKAARAMERSQR